MQAMALHLPAGIKPRAISLHRTPADQFELFKEGRKFINGSWTVVDKSKVITYKDGFINPSRHNYLPATAFDTGLFQGSTYLADSPHYSVVGVAAQQLNFAWGGDWQSFQDRPHIEIPPARFFKDSIQKDVARLWQKYLRRTGKYTKALDGIFGQSSQDALLAETGFTERKLEAWAQLFDRYGPVENLPDE
jgi:D-alanyl-D-alanine carboxypeptidase